MSCRPLLILIIAPQNIQVLVLHMEGLLGANHNVVYLFIFVCLVVFETQFLDFAGSKFVDEGV